MNRNVRFALTLLLLPAAALTVRAQSPSGEWTLRQCIDYARQNNIQVQSTELARQSSEVDLQQARAARVPSLSFSTGQNVVHQKKEQDGNFASNGTYSGNYALNANITIYGGGKLQNSLSQQRVIGRTRELEVSVAQNDIEIAVTQAYLNILYANESVKTNRQTVESSEAQMVRSKALLEAGSISQSDYAQMESQYSDDRYQLTVSETNLAQYRLQLKQLLELDLGASFDVAFPALDSADVLAPIPSLDEVYRTSLSVMPEMESGRLGIESSRLGEKIAAADGRPTITANASVGTGNISGTNYSFYNQLNNKLNESAGITLSVPIFNNRKAKSSVAKARIATLQAQLDLTNTEKTLLKTVESLYQDAVSAQSRYRAATDKVQSSELSYSLVQEQFNAGMKNTVELLTEKNNYLAAQQEQIQAKYQAVLSLRLLNFYRNEPIEL